MSSSSSSDPARQSAATDVEESKRLSEGSVASSVASKRESIGPDGQPKFKQKKRRTHQSRANGLTANSAPPASSGGGPGDVPTDVPTDVPAPVANEDALAC